jgi:hypothetical protein
VEKTMDVMGSDPNYGAELTFYYGPGSHNGDKTLKELIK